MVVVTELKDSALEGNKPNAVDVIKAAGVTFDPETQDVITSMQGEVGPDVVIGDDDDILFIIPKQPVKTDGAEEPDPDAAEEA
ncbi:hypothetical protein KKG41_02470 [Patescibacteria group bacterium]|nr:hypothetical protein [Patescibacteria group bacterium]MBU1889894.1 hypothetical protein [Patescibacteria group bacterium]